MNMMQLEPESSGFATLFRQLGRALKSAARGFGNNPLIQVVTVGIIGLSLTLVGGVRLVGDNVTRLQEGWGVKVQMAVFLEDGVTPARAAEIAGALGRLPGVEGTRIIEPRVAYDRLRRSLGSRAAVLDGVEESFLPMSIEVSLRPGVAEVLRTHPAYEKLRRAPGVEEVQLMGDWAARVQSLSALLRDAGWLVGLLIACACLYIVASTIRLGVFARRQELEILKLVGATNGFVRAPFLIEGAAQGLAGAGLAAGLLYVVFRLAQPRVEALLGDLMLGGPVRFFGTGQLLLALTAGAALGLVGSWLAVGRHVKAA